MAIKSGWTGRSRSHPERGIVEVKTTGYNQEGKVVIEFKRTIMVYLRACAQNPSHLPPFLTAVESSAG